MKRIYLLFTTLLAILTTASVHATIIDFESLVSPTTTTMPSYSEDGFDFTSGTAGSTTFAAWGTTDINFAGSTALFNNFINETTSLTAAGGGAFSLDSIDLSEVYNQSSYNATSVVFDAVLAGGGSASFTADLDLSFGFETFNFGGLFSNVVSVSWNQTPDFHQFDNLNINTVPEPSLFALLSLGLFGIGVARRKKV